MIGSRHLKLSIAVLGVDLSSPSTPTLCPLGDDSSWRKASIQPVPIPDLGHTGIRIQFSPGMGDSFAPDGAMTEAFRADIHDSVYNLPRGALPDRRDVRARDCARATRKHRLDPCGGSLVHAHMASLELKGASSTFSFAPADNCGWSRVGSPMRQNSSRQRSFQNNKRLSPPTSPLSVRRTLVGYGSSGVVAPAGERPSSRVEDRKALLFRELNRVKRKAGGLLSGKEQVGWTGVNIGSASDRFGPPTRRYPTSDGRVLRDAERCLTNKNGGLAPVQEATQMATVLDDRFTPKRKPLNNQRGRVAVSGDKRLEGTLPLGKEHGPQGALAVDSASVEGTRSSPAFRGTNLLGERDIGCGAQRNDIQADYFCTGRTHQKQCPARGKRGKRRGRRPSPFEDPKNDDGGDGGDSMGNGDGVYHNNQTAALPPATGVGTVVTLPPPFMQTLKKSRQRKGGRTTQRRLRKPCSAESLFECLLDMRYGDTNDLSPDSRNVAERWDLRALPAGAITTAARGCPWEGSDGAELRSEGTDLAHVPQAYTEKE